MNIVVKTKFYSTFPILFMLLGSQWLFGQDIHFSQFYHSPLTLSPALTGVSSGDIRIGGIYRSQWNAADSPYRTILASADKKFYTGAHPDWWLSAGLNLFNDRAGDGNFSTTAVNVSGSYTRMLTRDNFLTIGVAAGFGQRTFDFDEFTFDNQWNGTIVDFSRATGENFNDTNNGFPTFAAGFNWRGQRAKFTGKPRTKMDLGAGVFHINTPDQSFKNDQSDLPFRISFYFLPTIQLNQQFDVVGAGTVQIQGEYTEMLAGAALKYHLSTKKAKELALQFGFTTRFNSIGDAVIPAAELHYRSIMVGFSWDVNISDFSAATNRNGGPELTLRYIIRKVYPLSAFKACPLI
jgi:type IX secretion system PorP/SprF family membrane protein